uniref:Uncharacterized protein n=1 Tax=Meloidogyne enterolobii TaxID=390850 RepID=A0A6V7V0Y4_MELEN|nr:unnamed protein product [Meloidogyne enterolobii]
MVSSSSASTPHKRLISNISSWKESQQQKQHQEQLGFLQMPSTEQVVAELLAKAAETQFQATGVQPVDLDRYKEQQEEQRQKTAFSFVVKSKWKFVSKQGTEGTFSRRNGNELWEGEQIIRQSATSSTQTKIYC